MQQNTIELDCRVTSWIPIILKKERGEGQGHGDGAHHLTSAAVATLASTGDQHIRQHHNLRRRQQMEESQDDNAMGVASQTTTHCPESQQHHQNPQQQQQQQQHGGEDEGDGVAGGATHYRSRPLSWYPSHGGFTFIPPELLSSTFFTEAAAAVGDRGGGGGGRAGEEVCGSRAPPLFDAFGLPSPSSSSSTANMQPSSLLSSLPFAFAPEGSVPFNAIFSALESFIHRELQSMQQQRGSGCDGGDQQQEEGLRRTAADDDVDGVGDLIFLGDRGIYAHGGSSSDGAASMPGQTMSPWECLYGCSIRIAPQMNPPPEIVITPAQSDGGGGGAEGGSSAATSITTYRMAPTLTLQFTPILRRFQWFHLPLPEAKLQVLARGGIVVDGASEDSHYIRSGVTASSTPKSRGRSSVAPLGGDAKFHGGGQGECEEEEEESAVVSAVFDDTRAVIVPSLHDVTIVAVSAAFPCVDLAQPMMRPFSVTERRANGICNTLPLPSSSSSSSLLSVQQQQLEAHCALQSSVVGASWAPPRVGCDAWCLVTYPSSYEGGGCGDDGPSTMDPMTAARHAHRTREYALRRHAAKMRRREQQNGSSTSNAAGTANTMHRAAGHANGYNGGNGGDGGCDDFFDDFEGDYDNDDNDDGTIVTVPPPPPPLHDLATLSRAHHLVPSGRLWRFASVRKGWAEILPMHRGPIGAVVERVLGMVLRMGVGYTADPADTGAVAVAGCGDGAQTPADGVGAVGGSVPLPATSPSSSSSFLSFFRLPTDDEQALHAELQPYRQQQQREEAAQRQQQYAANGGSGGGFWSTAGCDNHAGGAFNGGGGGFQFCNANINPSNPFAVADDGIGVGSGSAYESHYPSDGGVVGDGGSSSSSSSPYAAISRLLSDRSSASGGNSNSFDVATRLVRYDGEATASRWCAAAEEEWAKAAAAAAEEEAARTTIASSFGPSSSESRVEDSITAADSLLVVPTGSSLAAPPAKRGGGGKRAAAGGSMGKGASLAADGEGAVPPSNSAAPTATTTSTTTTTATATTASSAAASGGRKGGRGGATAAKTLRAPTSSTAIIDGDDNAATADTSHGAPAPPPPQLGFFSAGAVLSHTSDPTVAPPAAKKARGQQRGAKG